MELVRFYGQTVECVFNIIHIAHVFVDIFHGTFRVPAPMQVALCAPPVNLERVSGPMSEPAISHQSCAASGFAVIELMYTTHNYVYYIYTIYILYLYISTLYNSQAVVSWTKQWSQTCWCSICSCLSFFATCTHLNWLIQNISLSRCCRFRGRVSNLLGSILGSEARHPSFPPAATPSAMPPGGVGLMDPSTIDIWLWLYYEYVMSIICYTQFFPGKKKDFYHAQVIY